MGNNVDDLKDKLEKVENTNKELRKQLAEKDNLLQQYIHKCSIFQAKLSGIAMLIKYEEK